MKKIYSGRATGKTTELIKIAAREHIPIVVFTHTSKGFTIKRINEMYKRGEIEYTPDVIACDETRIYPFSARIPPPLRWGRMSLAISSYICMQI